MGGHSGDLSEQTGSALACTEIPRQLPRPGPGAASLGRQPGPRSRALGPALAGYQRRLSKHTQPLQTHSHPDTSRLYIETGFARLTAAVPISARPAHTALIRRPRAPRPPSQQPFCSRRKRLVVPAPECLKDVNAACRKEVSGEFSLFFFFPLPLTPCRKGWGRGAGGERLYF